MQKLLPALLSLLAACDAATLPGTDMPPPPARMVGGERDQHGCLGPAGYTWCEREQACVRPWELAAAKGFAVENYPRYCAGEK